MPLIVVSGLGCLISTDVGVGLNLNYTKLADNIINKGILYILMFIISKAN